MWFECCKFRPKPTRSIACEGQSSAFACQAADSRGHDGGSSRLARMFARRAAPISRLVLARFYAMTDVDRFTLRLGPSRAKASRSM
jgi:hypothetical protein